MKTETAHPYPPLWLVLGAFAAVYLIWGSTYLGIRFAIESIPPFLMAGSRNLTAGLLMFALARTRSSDWPTLSEWRDATIIGALLLVMGNGGVTWAEQSVASGVAALLVAVTPAWIVVFDWLSPNGRRPGKWVIAGLAVGFAGVALLATGHQNGPDRTRLAGITVLMLASLSWSFGSIFSRSAKKPKSPIMTVSMQMIAGGVILLILSAAIDEPARFSFERVTAVSVRAWLYLVLAGSMIGYTAFAWLMHVSTPARVSTYGYVNPLIAVLLGCTIGREPFSRELLIAAGMIGVSVALIVRGSAKKRTAPAANPNSAATIKPVVPED